MDKRTFKAMLESGEFASMVSDTVKGEVIGDSVVLYNVLKPLMALEPDREKFYCVFLDSQNRVKSIDCLFTGTLTAAAVYPREVLKRAFDVHAAAVIFAHNHPSGSTNPSREDLAITRRLLLVCEACGVTVHEHIVIGDGYYSFADHGHISVMRSSNKD